MTANTPDNCYLDKGHSAHDLMAPGDTCEACGFVAASGRYRKKPVVIEAFHWEGGVAGWPAWLHAAWNLPPDMAGSVRGGVSHLSIHTLEGEMRVALGDWIIRGVKGELYPCKPDIFAATYELAL